MRVFLEQECQSFTYICLVWCVLVWLPVLNDNFPKWKIERYNDPNLEVQHTQSTPQPATLPVQLPRPPYTRTAESLTHSLGENISVQPDWWKYLDNCGIVRRYWWLVWDDCSDDCRLDWPQWALTRVISPHSSVTLSHCGLGGLGATV